MSAPSLSQSPLTVRTFTRQFRASRLGARLARQIAVAKLASWGVAPDSTVSETAALIVAELASNAVAHGQVPGRDFELRVTLDAHALDIEVSDARGERRPPSPGSLPTPDPLSPSGRGLLLVEALASRWSIHDRDDLGKTLVATLDLPSHALG